MLRLHVQKLSRVIVNARPTNINAVVRPVIPQCVPPENGRFAKNQRIYKAYYAAQSGDANDEDHAAECPPTVKQDSSPKDQTPTNASSEPVTCDTDKPESAKDGGPKKTKTKGKKKRKQKRSKRSGQTCDEDPCPSGVRFLLVGARDR